MTPADRHDRDKLLRWREEIGSEDFRPLLINAIFLVTEAHKEAHDIFRRFRDRFRDLSAPFSSLVIFGQHGSSTAMQALAKGLGLPLTSLPLLVLFRHYNDKWVVGFPLERIGGRVNSLEQDIHDLASGSADLTDLLPKYSEASTIPLAEGCMRDIIVAVVNQTAEEGASVP